MKTTVSGETSTSMGITLQQLFLDTEDDIPLLEGSGLVMLEILSIQAFGSLGGFTTVLLSFCSNLCNEETPS